MTEKSTLGRLLPPGLTLLACGLIWLAYENLGLLRGTLFWELRYVTLGCAVILLLTGLERLNAWLSRLLPGGES